MSLTNSEIFRTARVNLTGKYRLGISAFLIANIATMVIQLPFQSLEVAHPNMLQQCISFVVTLLIALLSILLSVGQYSLHLQFARPVAEETLSASQVFYCFKNHPDRYIVCGFLTLLMFAACLIPTGIGVYLYLLNEEGLLLLILLAMAIISVAAILFVQVRFSFAFFLLLDNAELSVMDSLRQSFAITSSHGMQILLIYLYFVGLDILSLLSFGFAMLWVAPYQFQILSVTYLDLTGAFQEQPTQNPTIDIVIE